MRAVLYLAIFAAILPAQSLEDQIAKIAKDLQPLLVECRRDIHMHPELSNNEVRTGKLIAEKLRTLGLEDIKPNVAGNGVTAVLKGGKPGPVVAWRADMDALPIDESNFSAPYKSTVKGVKHACGHDAHTTIGLGIAETLSKVKDQIPGTVKFLFQPAEEGVPGVASYGARLMVSEGALENPKPSAIYAFHVAGNVPVGKIAYTDEAASSASSGVNITFTGRRSHGAYPYQGIDAVAVASQCILALQTIHSRRIDTVNPSVFTLGTIHGGDRRNVIAETVTLTGTIRTFSEAVTDQYEALIKQTLDGCTSAMSATYDFKLRRGNIPMMNNPGLNKAALPVIERVLGPGSTVAQGPGLFGEDFSQYQKVIPGTMLFLGTANAAKGITAGVHTAEFDIDEDALSLGVHTGSKILLDYLTRNAK
jgi:amidohydrolase